MKLGTLLVFLWPIHRNIQKCCNLNTSRIIQGFYDLESEAAASAPRFGYVPYDFIHHSCLKMAFLSYF